uniref:PPM-type phosphatase domain-containing protein n=1 Tax=Callorhinchus milii TaxID=7868 RepID=A0A4W3GSW9_CALMI
MVSYFFKGEQCDEVGPYLDKPVTEKFGTQGSGNALRYGMSSMQGWRAQMEDAHTIVPALPKGLQAWSFYAVFDGHAGSKVAHYCSENLLGYITGNEDFGSSAKPLRVTVQASDGVFCPILGTTL